MRPLVDHGLSTSSPTVKFNIEGGGILGCLVDTRDLQERVFGTTTLAYWQDGSPKMQKKVTLALIRHRDVEFSGDPVDPPEVVTLWIKGPRLTAYRDAVRAYAEAHGSMPTVGSVLKAVLAELRPSKTKGYKPIKWMTFEFGPETAEVRQYADLAESEHARLQAADRPMVDHSTPPTGEPF